MVYWSTPTIERRSDVEGWQAHLDDEELIILTKDDHVKTSSFRTYTGPGRICIARYAPRGHPAGYRMYSKLAPGPWFNKVSIDEYCRLYRQILAGLDPQRTYDELVALMAPAEPVLLCYEVPPFTAPRPIPEAGLTTIGRENWCHRRIVAVWFQETLGIEVAELELPHGSLAAPRKRTSHRAAVTVG